MAKYKSYSGGTLGQDDQETLINEYAEELLKSLKGGEN